MLRIGDFSQLAQVSVPTLRHYDELGLLKPAHVDQFTDYRYYTVEQLPRLNRILALKDLGLSLDQIKQLLKADVPPAQLRGMLAMKRADIEQQLAQEQARLARVEARLQQIEQEGGPSRYEVVVKKVDALTIAGIRQHVPHVSQMADFRAPTLRALYDGLVSINGTSARDARDGAEMMLYHNDEYRDEDIDMEVAVALDGASVRRAERAGLPIPLHIQTLPAVATMATTIHHGVLWDIPQAIIALFAWIGTNGFRSAGPIRELHLFGREADIPDDRAAWEQPRVMEIQIPVERE
jgi:DNA-binding transcriptional MerR regulator